MSCPCCESLAQEDRGSKAYIYESIAKDSRAAGEFEAAARWDDYARAMREHGNTRHITANGTNAAWVVATPQVSYLDV